MERVNTVILHIDVQTDKLYMMPEWKYKGTIRVQVMLSKNMTLDICSIHYKCLLSINHVRIYGKLKNEKPYIGHQGNYHVVEVQLVD